MIGYVDADRLIERIDAVMAVQRDYGDRVDRPARASSTRSTTRVSTGSPPRSRSGSGVALEPAQPYAFTSNGDPLGWTTGDDGREHCTPVHRERPACRTRRSARCSTGCAPSREVHNGTFRLTPNQSLIIADIAAEDRPGDRGAAAEHGLDGSDAAQRAAPQLDGLRRAADLRRWRWPRANATCPTSSPRSRPSSTPTA